MLRQSPSRNQRSKGIKIKQVLQICLLLAVCFWLIYQVKHSHDKKKEFDENDAKKSLNIQIGNEIFKFGRKDLHPQVEETTKKIEKHDEEETEEEETGGGEEEKKNEEEAEEKAGGEEENKHEEEDQEEENKIDEKEDEGRGAGEDDIDEDDQEKTEVELDREEDFIDEEKETEEGDEKESEVKDVEDKDGSILENESSLEDHDHDEGNRNTREAREEQYKADDASSAVTHDTQTISTENENGSVENSNEKVEVNILEREDKVDVASSAVNHDTQTISTEKENGSVENSNEKVEVNNSQQEDKVDNTEEINVGQNTTGLKLGDGEISENGTSLNAMLNEEKGYEILVSKSEGSSFANSTITTVPNDQPEISNNSTEVSTEFNGLSLHTGTETTSSVTQAQNVTEGDTTSAEGSNLQNISFEQANYSNIGYDNNQSVLNSTTENVKETLGESSNISTNSEVVVSENIERSNASTEAENRTGSSLTDGNSDATQNEKLDMSNGTDESSDSNKLNNGDEIQHDPLDSSIPLEEKEIPIDTLPEIRIETRSNSERAAAE